MTQGPLIRRATLDDVESMRAIKRRLAMPTSGTAAPGGGFLLGSSTETYRAFIERAHALVLVHPEQAAIVGFAIVLPDAVVRASDLWNRREMIGWEGNAPTVAEGESIGYFEQLAVLPERRHRLYAPALALAAYLELVRTGHEHLFATVVRRPVYNTAAVPLLESVGARRVGTIDEEYEGVGSIVSDVYHARIDGSTITSHPMGSRILEMMRRTTSI